MRIWSALSLVFLLALVGRPAHAQDEDESEEEPEGDRTDDDESEDPEGWAEAYLEDIVGPGGKNVRSRSREAGAGAAVLNWSTPGALFGFGSLAVGVSGDKRLGGTFHVAYIASALGANLLARYSYGLAGGDPKWGMAAPIVFGSLQVLGGMLWIEGVGNYSASVSVFGIGTTTPTDRDAALTMMFLGGMSGIIGFVGMLTDTQVMVKAASRERRIEQDRGRDYLFEPRLTLRDRLRLSGFGAAPMQGGARLGVAFSW